MWRKLKKIHYLYSDNIHIDAFEAAKNVEWYQAESLEEIPQNKNQMKTPTLIPSNCSCFTIACYKT